MIKVCLDQCAISALAEAGQDDASLFAELRQTLVQAAEDLKLIAPVAPETIVETTGIRSSNRRLLIHELHTRLADARLGGPVWAFKSMWKMINEETVALARSEAPPSAFELIHWDRVENDQLASKTWSEVAAGKQRMLDRVNAHPLVQVKGDPTLDATSKGVILEHAADLYRQVQRLLLGQQLDANDHMAYDLGLYLQQQQVTHTQLEKLVEDILHHRWESIPVIFNRTRFAGQLEMEYRRRHSPRNYNVNDEFDLARLAVGLWSADLIITDGPMAQVCQNIGTKQWTRTRVLAVNDIDGAMAYLADQCA